MLNLLFKNEDKLLGKAAVLKAFMDRKTLDKAEYNSSLANETFSSLWTEGEVSSRKNAGKLFEKKSFSKPDARVNAFLTIYQYILFDKPQFSVENFFTIYNIMFNSSNDNEKNALEPGFMIRQNKGYVYKTTIVEETMDSKEALEELQELINYLNKKDNDELILKSIKAHYWFLVIHPYYDLNGRTSRFIPIWLFANNGLPFEMSFFATAMNNFRDQYLSAFNNTIDRKRNKYDLDKFANKVLDLLILHEYQLSFLNKIEQLYLDKGKGGFNIIQKWFIWFLMIKSETQGTVGWNKLTKEDKNFIDTETLQSNFSRDIGKLYEADIIDKQVGTVARYKLKKYDLYDL